MRQSFKYFLLILLTAVSVCLPLWSAPLRQLQLTAQAEQVSLSSNSDFGFELQITVPALQINEIKTRGGVFDEISLPGYGFSGRIGEPKLPVWSKLIAVPVGAEVSFDVIGKQEKTFSRSEAGLLHDIVPAQPSLSKSDDPDKIPFEQNSAAYRLDAFTRNELFKVSEVGYLRGVRLFRIDFEPVRYNAVTRSLQVCSELSVKVRFNHPDLAATQELQARTASWEYERVYAGSIFNWDNNIRTSLVRYPTKMVILTPANYVSTLQPFVDWKKQQGFDVIVTTVGTGGTISNSTTAIKTYLQGLWDNATAGNPAPTFLLIVGDTSTSGDNIIANTGEASSAHVTDLTYVRLNGTDYIPEMYFGRFSVSSATELTNIINKTLMFEKTTMPDLSYLGKAVMIAGADASYAPTYGNGQINYGTTYYFNTGNGITSNTYLYPESASSDASIIANANEGRGYINYTAHGSETSWADPTFSVSNLNAMTNTNKYFVAVGNCCITNKFNYTGGPCFGEALIRAADKAGVAYIGCTNNSYWDEDYWWGIGYKTPIQAAAHNYNASTLGAYDAMFHTHGEAVTDWARTMGETNLMGLLAVEQSTSSRKPYYWEIYSIMGDPSLSPYFGVPSVNTATYPAQILIGATAVNITAAPYSRVAITMGGTLYGTGITDAAGSLSLTINPFSTVGTADIVITAQNKIT